jgi:23S rRNA pseudouridine2605 synthase
VSYGPFQIGELKPGEVEEVRAKALREQIGLGQNKPEKRAEPGSPTAARARRPRRDGSAGG